MTMPSYTFTNVNYVSPLIKPIFDPLIFTDISQVVELKKHTILYCAGDPGEYVYVVLNGIVEHFITSVDGAKKIVGISGLGCIVGELPLFNNMVHFCHAQVSEKAKLYKIIYRDFYNLIQNDTILLNKLLLSMTQKIHVLHTQIELLEFCDALSRIARMLLFLCDDHGTTNYRDEILIGLKFTHYDMAFMTGLSRVTVSNAFSRMARDGIIRKKSGRYFITNRTKLEELC